MTKKLVMKKELLLIMCMLTCMFAADAQYSFRGILLYTNGQPVKNKQVFVKADSTINPAWMPTFSYNTLTDSNGLYNFTLPVSVVNGMKIQSSTVNCNSVLLTNTHTYGGTNILNSDFTICITPTPVISGQLSLGSSGQRAANAKVLLLERVVDSNDGFRNYYSIIPIDSIIATTNGNFAFTYPTGHAGKLIVHAMLQPTSPNYSKYVPTYHNAKLQWDAADTLPTGVGSTLNFALKAGNTPGGPCYITGFVQAGPDVGVAIGTPLPNRTIILTDINDNPIGYTLSDINGTFSFVNLPYGSYKIFCDNYGKYCTPLSFVLSNQYPVATQIKFEEKKYTYNLTMPPLSIAAIGNNQSIGLYPNPTTNTLYVKGLNNYTNITVYDITGRQLLTQIISPQNNSINTNKLSSGVYVLQLKTGNETHTIRFTKE